jgi:hypothetical protein
MSTPSRFSWLPCLNQNEASSGCLPNLKSTLLNPNLKFPLLKTIVNSNCARFERCRELQERTGVSFFSSYSNPDHLPPLSTLRGVPRPPCECKVQHLHESGNAKFNTK